MRHGLEITNLGDYADARVAVRFAQAAEEAAWEGLFVWDHLAFAWGVPSGDPWVILSAVAASTTRLKLGTAVTPLARRRPQVVANALATLDLLSGGRVVFGAGLGGVEEEFSVFGETADAKKRAAMLDEGLHLLDKLLPGEELTHHGEHYTVEGAKLAPLPLQSPRIPIWIGGDSMAKDPERIAEMVAEIVQYRTTHAPFEVAGDGYTDPGDTELPRAYEQAGATWWLESIHGMRGDLGEMMVRVQAGPAG